jgi:hypothetical protein
MSILKRRKSFLITPVLNAEPGSNHAADYSKAVSVWDFGEKYKGQSNHRNPQWTVARYLAAHSPTESAALQRADIARRLMRGGELHQEEGASS